MTTVIERRIPATDLPAYVGWTLNGVTRTDGVLAWGALASAEVVTLGGREVVSIVHPRNVKGRNGWESVPEGALVGTDAPAGPHMVTVSHGCDGDACALCSAVCHRSEG